MSRWAGPALVGGGQLLVGLLFLAVGVAYDWAQRPPGILTIAALLFLGGPGFALALREAQRSRVTVERIPDPELAAPPELRQLDDGRRR